MTTEQISFRALQLANEHRTAYGLRSNDYNHYRKHCANRTHRLRSTLRMTHGKGREFKKLPPITQDNIRDAHLRLLLFEAERAWAYAQELNTSSLSPSNSEKASTLRHSATGRFRRAIHWSTQLLSHCQTLYAVHRLSAESLLEATVYTLITNGRFLRYREELEDALNQLSVARSLLDELAAQATTSRDQALATLFADEIGPEIRFCAHGLGRSKAYDVDSIVQELSSQHRNALVDQCDALIERLKSEGQAGSTQAEGRKKLKELVWEDEPVPVRNPELVDVLLRVQDAEAKLDNIHASVKAEQSNDGKQYDKRKGSRSKKSVAAYDSVLLALSDAEDVARKLVEAQQSTGTSSTSVSGTRDIHFIYAFIVYQLLSRRIQRDLLLISALLLTHQPANQRPAQTKSYKSTQKEQVDARLYPAVVKLLDTVLQSLEQMRTLSVVDESPDLATAVEVRILYTKARRCLFLSRCYAGVKKYAESLSLIQRSELHLREARSVLSTTETDSISSGHPSFYSLPLSEIEKLEQETSADGLQFKKAWFAFNGGSVDPEKHKSHKKPLFFDIALNYVQLDMDRLQDRAGKAKAPATAPSLPEKKPANAKAKVDDEDERAATPVPEQPRGGLSSLLGGWWGRQ